jgi:hypothetical protein
MPSIFDLVAAARPKDQSRQCDSMWKKVDKRSIILWQICLIKCFLQDEELRVPFLLHIPYSQELVFHIQARFVNLLRDTATTPNKLFLRIRAEQKQQE